MINPVEFKDKQILLTGSAVGIGRAVALLLNQMGANIVMIDIDEPGLEKLSSELKGERHKSYCYDLKNLEGIEGLVSGIVSEKGPFDGFVHCVGIRSRRPLSMLKPSAVADIMGVNFGSFIELVRCTSKSNHFRPGYSIVGVSSVSAHAGSASVTAYAASKGAMESAVRCIAKEMANRKIRINTVIPSQINTPEYVKLRKNSPSEVEQLSERQYLGLGEPIDVANAIIFLLSDMSRFITGSSIAVDGGFLAS